MDKLHVAKQYTFDLAVRNVRGQIASIFLQGGAYAEGRRDVIGHSYEVNSSAFIAVTLPN